MRQERKTAYQVWNIRQFYKKCQVLSLVARSGGTGNIDTRLFDAQFTPLRSQKALPGLLSYMIGGDEAVEVR
jgi:hypothetical protein